VDVTASYEEILSDFEKLNSSNYGVVLPAYYDATKNNAEAPFSPIPDFSP